MIVIAVLGTWESGWMDAERTERRLWKQTIQAFGVDAWAMAPERGGPFTSPVQFPDFESMLEAYQGRKTFVIPPGRVARSVDLAGYDHPESAIYVLGNAAENLTRYVTDGDDVVSICTPNDTDMFAPVALAAVLYDREVKR